ncbi:hypothetical protein BDW75DRAFT_238175 [Aspergillus navahoensis]
MASISSHNQDLDRPPGTMNADASASALNHSVVQPGQSDPGAYSHRSSTATVEDYSRIMLEYTQRRMARFAQHLGETDRRPATSRSSRSSNTSGTSTSGILAAQASGPAPGPGPAGQTHPHAVPKTRHVGFGADVADGV